MMDPQAAAPPDVLLARRQRLLESSRKAGFGAILASRPEHVRYLTGSDGPGPRALLVDPEATRLITPADPDDAGDLGDQEIDLVTFQAYASERFLDPDEVFADHLGRLLRSVGSVRIGCDTASVPARPDDLRAADIADATLIFAAARRPRDRWEITAIRGRVAIVEAGLRAARAAARAGVTELEVVGAAAGAISRELGEPVRLDHNVGSGPRSALSDPHASPRVIADGELLLVDLYPPLRGYYADLTRTWAVGSAYPEATRQHEAVRSALRAGEGLLGPGAKAVTIDRAVREALRVSGGFDASMGHHTGHGLGIFAWEHPWIGWGSNETLMPGDVVALEPGTYRPGSGGVRVEGNYLITDDGYERIDSLDEELVA